MKKLLRLIKRLRKERQINKILNNKDYNLTKEEKANIKKKLIL